MTRWILVIAAILGFLSLAGMAKAEPLVISLCQPRPSVTQAWPCVSLKMIDLLDHALCVRSWRDREVWQTVAKARRVPTGYVIRLDCSPEWAEIVVK